MAKLRARAAHLNIEIEQGATYELYFTWKADGVPVNLTGATAEFVLVGDGAALNDATVVLGGVLGTVAVTIPAASSALYDFASGAYYLDVTLGGVVWRLLQGDASLIIAPVGA